VSATERLDGRLLDSARSALWAGLRLVVIDIETCSPPERGTHRVVSLAAVACHHAATRGSWSTYVNPQCPIDAGTQTVHGITDELVAVEPTFDVAAKRLVSALEPVNEERVVLVAHHVGNDVGVLRSEFDRVGLELPEVAVLDTMGRLPRHVGVRTSGGSLADLADTLGVINPRPHDALADAQTCAQIVVKLLDLAAARGIDDFDQLLDEVSGGATTATVRAKRSGKSSPASSRRSIDPEHIDTHLDIPSGRVRDAGIHRWAAQVEQCCRLRCPGVVDRVEQAGPAPDRLLSALDDVLVRLADEGDGPGAAPCCPLWCRWWSTSNRARVVTGYERRCWRGPAGTHPRLTGSTGAAAMTDARRVTSANPARWTPGGNRSHRWPSATSTSAPAASSSPTGARLAPAPTPPG
jgi:DNA polymerase III epsilon subunit-like protein